MKRIKLLIKMALFGLGIGLALMCLSSCILDLGGGVSPGPGNQLSVAVNPASGYPPLDVTITASGVTEGQYTFTVEGHTYTQGSDTKRVTLHALPCEGEVIWERPGYVTQRAQFYIALDNKPPVVGRLRLNGLDDLWYLHPRHRYIGDNPGTYDPEGGPVTLIEVHVQVARKSEEDTVFCPPYAGPGIYHALDRNHRLIENAFVFHSTWTGPLDAPGVQTGSHVGGYTYLPFSPPGYGESGYPFDACVEWLKAHQQATETTITETWRDQDGGETTKSWTIPTGPDPGCNIY